VSKQKRLIIIEGIPGSGKTTTAKSILDTLTSRQVAARCFLEEETLHPLLLQGMDFSSFENEEEADQFIELLTARYRDFVQAQLNSDHEVIIIESVFFQDAISVAHLLGMDKRKLLDFSSSLQKILTPLTPSLIYYYQLDVEKQWRFICSVRGNEWGPVSLNTDEDFQQAAEVWAKSQAFVRAIVDHWAIPKLIIENSDYLWGEYKLQISEFIDSLLPVN
jgi:thymidylate kinase